MHHDDKAGDLFIIPGMSKPVPMGLVAAAGKPAEEITVLGVDFDELHRGGWDPDARLPEQDRDGVAGEIIYPTVGMVLCNHKDLDYKHACMEAYNRWIAELLQRPSRSALRHRPDRHAHARGGHRRPRAHQGPRLQGRHDAGRARRRRLRLAHLRRLLRGGHRSRAAAVVPHPHRAGRAPARSQDQRLHHHRPRLPGRHGHLRVRRRLRAPSGPARSCASRPTPAGCRTTCTAWTTPTSATATGWPTATCTACRASTSARTST